MKTIIALDPGGTTGWASLSFEPSKPLRGGYEGDISHLDPLWNVGQMGPNEHHKQLYNFLEERDNGDLSVVCESFEFRQGKQREGINLMSREYIGLVKLFRDDRRVPTFFQTAAQAKMFVTDEKIKALDLWWPGKKHAMDAMRHLVTYLVQKERRVELVKVWKDL